MSYQREIGPVSFLCLFINISMLVVHPLMTKNILRFICLRKLVMIFGCPRILLLVLLLLRMFITQLKSKLIPKMVRLGGDVELRHFIKIKSFYWKLLKLHTFEWSSRINCAPLSSCPLCNIFTNSIQHVFFLLEITGSS